MKDIAVLVFKQMEKKENERDVENGGQQRIKLSCDEELWERRKREQKQQWLKWYHSNPNDYYSTV